MDFFKKLSELLPEKVTLNFSVINLNGELTILVTPQGTTSKVVPMSIKGTPEEIDKHFHTTIGESLTQNKELMVKMEAHQENLKKKQAELENTKEEAKKANLNKLKNKKSKKDDEEKDESLFDSDDDKKDDEKESEDEE